MRMLRRCVFRSEPRQPGKNVIAPGSFPPQAESLTHALKLSIPTRRINDHNEERQKNTMLEKFAMFSRDFLSGIITDDDGAYVFQMSPTEQEIVKYVGSSYVLGRSGTGKTTTMLYKILGIERAWQELLQQDRELEGSSGKPRQMFVTQSKMLAKNVEGYYDKLVASHGMGRRSNQQHHDLLINLDEETEWRKDLPHRFGLLKDEHFPLFLTFDELCKMLENESDHASKLQSSSNTLSDSDSSQQDSFVSWRRFRSVYWDHFPQNLTKLFEPYLVFGEFMGIIKGSEMTLTSNTGYLDSATYLGLSHRAADTFASSREEIYHLFEVYLRLKKEYGDNDAADRTQKLPRLMTELGIPGQAIDYIYVDETQDNLLIDTLVLRSLCRNSMGLFWAGDTAQTISAGSAFRFKDLKAFLWRIENKLYKSSSLKITKAPVHPKEFQLAINYRSHAGIIDCAQTVIHILTKFWPNAIDILKEEKGDNDGVKPIMFTGWSEHTLPFEQHLFGDRHHQIEFGANQCILVRNEEARVQLRERVGAVGMILTLQESKGLEFNDVLLYNFFNDSGVSLSNWRIVLNIIQDNDAKTTRNLDVCHTVVCRELKFLYVAITRARNNVWIADSSNKGDHMRDVWLSRDQIEICTPNDPIPKLAVSSAQAEWAERGRSLFKNGTYRQAIHCFERAGMQQERNVAYAYSLQQEASLLPPSSDVHDATFVQAAEVFTQCASSTSVTEEAQAYYRLAGRCFTEIGNYQRAGDSFLAAHEYTGSAQAYRKADNFDTAVQVVQEHETDVDPDVAHEIIDVAKLHYFKEHDVEKAVELFDSLEEAVEYTEDFGFDEAQADILVGHMNQPTDAAELHFREGRIFTALDILLESPHDASIFSLCLRYIRAGLWRLISFGVQPSKVIDEAARYFSYTRKVSECYSLTDYDNMQIVMFSAILRDDHPTLHRLAAGFLLDHHDKAASGLCLDYVFAHSVEVLTAASTLEPMSSILRSFLEYVNILSFVAYDTDACTKDWVQQLFGFKTCGEKKTITMYQRTLVYSQVEGLSSSELANESTIPMQDFIPILQRVARERLKTRVQQENELCTLSPVIFPCIVFAIYGECSRTSCALGHTRSQQVFSAPAFNLRLRTVIQQILIYRTAEFLMEYNHQMRQRRFWLKSLYELLNPPHPTLGSLANVDWSTIPEFDKGVLTINYWVQDRLFSLNPFTLVEMSRWLFLSSVLQMSSLGFLLNFRQTQRYLHRVPFVYKRPPFNFISGHHSIIHSVLRSLDGSGNNPFNDGFVFLRHAIVTKLHLDISILCDLLDHLCGLLIVTFHKSFHNTILPRSWMLKLIGMNPIANSNLHLSLSSANDFVGVIHELLADIFSKDHYDRLFFANRKWYYSPSWDVIQIFLSRICRCLCLVGYNIEGDTLRNQILQTVGMLDSHARNPLHVCERYMNALSWDDLWRALRVGDKGIPSRLDELVLVQDLSKELERTIPGIKTISFTGDLEQLTIKLRGDTKCSVMEGRQAFLPVSPVNRTEVLEEPCKATPDPIQHGRKVERTILDSAETDLSCKDDEETANPLSLFVTPEKFAAAKTILRAYRNYVELKRKWAALVLLAAFRRRRVVQHIRLSAINETRRRWKESCQAARPHYVQDSYRLHLVVHLPRALVCLDRLNAYAFDCKAEAKQRLKADNSLLEDVNKALNNSIGMLKQVAKLQADLDPGSDFHHLQDARQFQQKMEAIKKLVFMLPAMNRSEWEFDFNMAMRAVKREGDTLVISKKRLKPCLNTEDLDIAYY
ncbi:hypothetical protein QCA50_019011 [Cerrena zonata]|uniref:UvrD-like helicase ATP-binding domain-containing protein n=1 Tax=Cerrena zonata TaxID=2478898 RepID=A0AAW0FN35_9APHY